LPLSTSLRRIDLTVAVASLHDHSLLNSDEMERVR
jgi:hypothetical protein